LNLYDYAHENLLRYLDRNGLTSFENFPSGKDQDVRDAIEYAKKRVLKCPTCGPDRDRLLGLLRRAMYIYDPDPGAGLCGEVTPWGWASNTIKIYPQAFNFGRCCDLASTLVHEANHLKFVGAGEPESRDVEKKCFSCPRSTP
jgi:hypothetical protein